MSFIVLKVLDKKRLCELVKEVDPAEQLDEDVEDVLLQVAYEESDLKECLCSFETYSTWFFRLLMTSLSTR